MTDVPEPQRNLRGQFVKGHRQQTRRRPVGVPNKISGDLKQGILNAAIEHGADGAGKDGLKGCMSWLLREHTKSFIPLLQPILPLQVQGEVNHTSKLTVNIVPIPRGHFYNAAGQLVKANAARHIEHDDAPTPRTDDLSRNEAQMMALQIVEADAD